MWILFGALALGQAPPAREVPAAPTGTEEAHRYLVLQDDKFGYIDRTGRVVIEPRYSDALAFSEGFAAVRSGDLYGYIGLDGTALVGPTYADAGVFSEGRAPVWTGTAHGYVDRTGTFHGTPNWTELSEGRALVEGPNRTYWFEDGAGNRINEHTYPFAQPFSGGRALVSVDGQVGGYIDTSGAMVVPPRYPNAGDFHEGYAVVSERTAAGDVNVLIDPAGTVKYRSDGVMGRVSEGLVVVSGKEGATSVVRPDGTAVFALDAAQLQANVGGEFSDGRLLVQRKSGQQAGLWGYVDTAGQLVIPTVYDDGMWFEDGLVSVRRGLGWGWIDRSGRDVWFPPVRTAQSPDEAALKQLVGKVVATQHPYDPRTGGAAFLGQPLMLGTYIGAGGSQAEAVCLARAWAGTEILKIRGSTWGVFVAAGDAPVRSAAYAAPGDLGHLWIVEEDPVTEDAWRTLMRRDAACQDADQQISAYLEALDAELRQLSIAYDTAWDDAAYRVGYGRMTAAARDALPEVWQIKPSPAPAMYEWRFVTETAFKGYRTER